MVNRKNIRNLLPDELTKLRDAHRRIMARIDNRSYQFIASKHGWMDMLCEHQFTFDATGQRMDLFLPWHRAYMYIYEKYLQNEINDSNLAMCYWNWNEPQTDPEGIPDAYAKQTIDDQPNPLYSYKMNISGRAADGTNVHVNRNTNRRIGEQLTIEDIRNITTSQNTDIPRIINNVDDFKEFSESLRNGWHNMIHAYVGGDMNDQNLAAYDPLFYAHHVAIDRIYYLWQLKHGINNIPEYLKDIPLAPWRIKVRDVLDIHTLDYDYASTVNET
jgi:tyrosinase